MVEGNFISGTCILADLFYFFFGHVKRQTDLFANRARVYLRLLGLGEGELCSLDTDWRHALRLCVFLPGWGLAGSSIMAFSTTDSSWSRQQL